MRVKGGGLIEAVNVNIEAGNLTVDASGIVKGKTHDLSCSDSSGTGNAGGNGGSGRWISTE